MKSATSLDKQQLKNKVLEYLAENRLMTVAVSSDNQPWAATVFFAFDRQPDLYFFSRADTKHAKYIARNPAVAGTINQAWGEPGFVRGIQFSGVAKPTNTKKHLVLFRKRYSWTNRYLSDHQLFKIKIKELYYIDHKLFGHFLRVRAN